MFNTSLLAKGEGVLLVGGGIVGAGTAYALNSGTEKAEKTISIRQKLSDESKKLLTKDFQKQIQHLIYLLAMKLDKN